jgi:hypothetical protein
MAVLDTFKGQLVGGGARANQFEVILTNPAPAGIVVDDAKFFVKTASLPGQTIDEIAVNYRGRILYIDGDRTFDTWTTSIINDTDFKIRNGIERWMNIINNMDTNVSAQNSTTFMSDMIVNQYDRKDKIIKTHTLINCWPTVLSPIELSWDTRSEVETFDVTWRYTKFTGTGTSTP